MKTIPITLVTGFLGAGKSTLLNRMLKEIPGRQLGFLVNEFGDVKLESQIIQASDEQVVELSGGCMCCEVRGDLVNSMAALLAKNPDLDHIVVEASGLSDPLPIVQTFLREGFGGRIRFDAVVTLVDSLHVGERLKDFKVTLGQLKWADYVVITKLDQPSDHNLEEIRKLILALAPKACVLDGRQPELLQILLDVHDLDHGALEEALTVTSPKPLAPSPLKKTPTGSKPGISGKGVALRVPVQVVHDPIETLLFKSSKPFHLGRLGKILDNLPPQVVRGKGILFLNTPESRGVKCLFQYVGSRGDLAAEPWKEGEKKENAMLLLGKDWNPGEVKEMLQSALCTQEEEWEAIWA